MSGFNVIEGDVNVHDKDGNGVTSTTEGANQRLDVDSFLSGQVGPIDVNATLKPAPPADFGQIARGFVKESGGNDDLRVDGSVIPKIFTFDADATKDIELFEIRLIITTDDIHFLGNYFLQSPVALTNGLLIEVISESGTVTAVIGNLKTSEDFLGLPFTTGQAELSSPKDQMVLVTNLGGVVVLRKGTSDQVKITVRDDLNPAVSAVKYFFKAQVTGLKV